MKFNRYGKFRFSDYYESWGGIAVLLMFSVIGLRYKISYFFVLFSLTYAIIWLVAIFVPNYEQFAICDDSIVSIFGNRTRTIILPSDLTLVVSYADICPPFSKRTAVGNQTHVLKNKYAITILQKLQLDVVLEALHRNYVRRYTTSMIQSAIDDHLYIYSFVCDQTLINKLTENRDYQLIIPESLIDKISFDFTDEKVHLDMGY